MDDALQDPAGTRDVGAVADDLVRRAIHRRAADGALLGHGELGLRAVPAVPQRAHDLRDDLAGPDDLDPVADADVLLGDDLLVVERGAADGDAAELDRLEHRPGRQGSRPPDVDPDLEQPRDGHLRRELPGDRPARLPAADHAEVVVQREPVDLHDDAVGLEGEGADHRLVPATACCTAARSGCRARCGATGNPHASSWSSTSHCVAACSVPSTTSTWKANSPSRRLRVIRASSWRRLPGGGVARVGEGRVARRFAVGVEPLERLAGEVDLAPDLHQRGVALALQRQREVGDGPEVGGHVLADGAVAAGGAGHEPAPRVGQVDGGAVDLDLGGVPAVPRVGVEPGVAVLPGRAAPRR